MRALSSGSSSDWKLVEPERARDRLGGLAVVAGQHDDAQAVGAQRGDRRGGALLDRILEADRAGELAVDRQHDRPLEGAEIDAVLLQEARRAEQQPLALDDARHAAPGVAAELGDRRRRHAPLARELDDRAGDRMLAVLLEAGGEPQRLEPAGRPR